MPIGPLTRTDRLRDLPEEVVDHVDRFTSVDIHQQHVVIIPDPAIGAVHFWQTIGPWIVDPIPVAVEQTVEMKPDVDPAVSVATIG